MATFKKTRECPSSWDLYDLSLYAARRRQDREMLAHVGRCDFCAAELNLYREFPPCDADEAPAPAIPSALRELADSVLTNQAVLAARLDALLGF